MNGNDIIAELLRGSAAVTAEVAAEKIRISRLPDEVKLPALLIRTISVVGDNPLSRGTRRRLAARIQVTTLAKSYRDQAAIVDLVRSACDGFVGTAAGAVGVSVRADHTGPDLVDEAGIFEQPQDFRVSFETAA